VVAAAIVLPYPEAVEGPQGKAPLGEWAQRVRDSKLLTPHQRQVLSQRLAECAVAMSLGMAGPDEIDERGIGPATRLAMRRAIEGLILAPDYVLTDYVRLPGLLIPHKPVPNGDSICFSVAAASIVAKVARDRMMVEMEERYPGYGFSRHKGYGTRAHLARLRQLGPCPIHRRSFSPVRHMLAGLL
jgi:ribonuclease HII